MAQERAREGRVARKVAIVTCDGSAEGIGAAIAYRLADEGAYVVVVDGISETSKEVADWMAESGLTAVPIDLDISDASSVEQMVRDTVQRFGKLDLLCNIATLRASNPKVTDIVRRDTTVVEMDMDTWDRTMAVNVSGSLLSCKYAIPEMIRSGGGSIVLACSHYGQTGWVDGTAYGVSRGATATLAKYVATQYGKQGIRCNGLVMAACQTGRWLARMTPEGREKALSHLLTPEIPRPEDLANSALFLLSDEARFVTGHLLAIDSGAQAHHPAFADATRA